MARGLKDNERSVMAELKEKVADYMAYWIAWKFAPELLPEKHKTFSDLKKNYTAIANRNLSEQDCERFLYSQKVQDAVKWLLKRQNGARMINLYNNWYNLALTDSNALREFLKLQKEFFREEEDSELLGILKNVEIGEDE